MFHIGIAVQHPPLPDPSQLSELGIDFIRQCLTIDPDTRPTAVELMSHPWIEQFKEELGVAYDEESAISSSGGGSSGWSTENVSTASSSLGSNGVHQVVLEEEEEEEEEGYGEEEEREGALDIVEEES
jgi:mitogen-activated protein kinase kinase kinase